MQPRRPSVLIPAALVIGAVLSVQVGASIAVNLFDRAGPGGTVFLRVGLAAVMLVALWRPSPRGLSRADLALVAMFGLTLAAMNFSFYLALDRIPLGIAVTFEFVGPLAVAVAGSRRPLDLAWVAMAGGGIVLLSPGIGGSLDATGVALALVAGAFWATYIVLSARVGRKFADGSGLALALIVSGLALVPVGVASGGSELLDPGVLAVGAVVALLSSAIPYSLELEALRRLPTGAFGVLMSIEPVVAAAVGFVVLGQGLATRELVAVGLVVGASAGALRAAARPPVVEP